MMEMAIGIEVHAELKTRTKIFCACENRRDAEPNTLVCPTCLGLPGALPVLNVRAVELAVKAGLATGCEIMRRSAFERKNYFYPDLPKAYQISQYEHPICLNGHIDVFGRLIGIERIHMEEDAGKLIEREGGTLVDLNRAGAPLIEIVTRPDLRTAREVVEFVKILASRLRAAGVSDCRMNEGEMRMDVNVSVRESESAPLGERCEIKNMNSTSNAGRAIEYEFARQTAIIESGERVTRETRRWDARGGRTVAMRDKEDAQDYRYFPDPDLPEVVLSEAFISKLSLD